MNKAIVGLLVLAMAGLVAGVILNRPAVDSSDATRTVDVPTAPSAQSTEAFGEIEEAPGRDGLYQQRTFPNGSIDRRAIKRARDQVMLQKQMRAATSITPTWQQQGPYNIQGRVTSLAVHPTDDNIAYTGAAEGGVWKTIDGGATWVSIFDDNPALSVGALTLDPSDPNVVFVGTGEVNPGRGSVAYGGNGVFRSDDAGATWTSIGLPDSGSIGRIVVHPTDSNIIHVAVMGHLWASSVERGVYRTTNGGTSWQKVLYINDTTGCVDIIQRPDDPDVLMASMWTRRRAPLSWVYGGIDCGVYRSDDGGVTWTLAGNGLPAPTAQSGRNGLAICESNPDVMCVVYSHGQTGRFTGLYRTTDGGANWTQTNDSSLENSYSSAGWWYGNVAINPNDEDNIWVIGFHDYKSTDGGQTYSVVDTSMHVDHHAMGFGIGANAKIYAGNDGGVYTSTDGISFTKTTGDFPITQTYRVAAAPWNDDALWLGTQDNGSSQDLNGDGDFARVFGGDGFECVPHLNDPNRLWVQYQYGNVFYSSNGGSSFSDARNGLSGRRNWNAPHAMDPNDTETRYFGTHFLFRNDGNTGWTKLTDDLTGGPGQGNSGQVDGTLTTINVSPADSDVIWVGADDGTVQVSQDGGNVFSHVSSTLPERWVTSVRPHPSVAAEALVTLSGFRWGEDMSHVYRTTDFGQNWTAVGNGLPDMPVNDVMYDANDVNRYFAATDIGVFETLDQGQTWSVMGTGMPSVVVNDLAFRDNTRELIAGTYGRSLYSIALPEVVPQSMTLVTGTFVDGSFERLASSDDVDVELKRNRLSGQALVEVQLKAVSHIIAPTQMSFTLESSIEARRTVIQRISLFNYDSDSFEQVDARSASQINDLVVEVVPTGDVSRFVQPGTGCMEAKLEYVGTFGKLLFDVDIDQAIWRIAE